MADKTIQRRTAQSDWWPELFPRRLAEWFDWPVVNTRDAEHVLRVEEATDGGDLVIRAEIPGIDPDKDVQIHVRDHVLEVRAERREQEETTKKGIRTSEFRYGSFSRVLTLPDNAKDSDIHASYEDGILEVRVPLDVAPRVEPKEIPVERKR